MLSSQLPVLATSSTRSQEQGNEGDGEMKGEMKAELCKPSEALYIDPSKVPQPHVRWVLVRDRHASSFDRENF